MRKKSLLALCASAAFMFVAAPANAVTVSIGLQEAGVNGGAITPEASGAGLASISGLSYGTFSSVSADGTGNPPLAGDAVLLSNSIDTSTTGTGTLNIFVTTQGNTSPIGLASFLSTFTENLITAGWSVTEKTFVDAGNGVFALTTPLSSAMLTAIGTGSGTQIANLGTGPWSLTEEYIVAAVGAGNANSTISAHVSAVPLPGAFSLFATGLLGLGLLGRKKRKALA